MGNLLHTDNFERIPITGQLMAERLQSRIDELTVAAADTLDEPVSVVIRSRNNAEQLEGLFADIVALVFGVFGPNE